MARVVDIIINHGSFSVAPVLVLEHANVAVSFLSMIFYKATLNLRSLHTSLPKNGSFLSYYNVEARVPLPRNANQNAEYAAAFAELAGYAVVALGLTDAASENDWVDNDGNAVSFTNWYSGEPDNGSGISDYAIMIPSNAKWFDVSTTYTVKIVCEKLN